MDVNPYPDLNLTAAVLMAALAVLVSAPLAWLASARASRKVRWMVRGVVLPAFLIFNPCSGWIIWEPVNEYLLTEMKVKAEAVGMEGRTFREVRALFGPPTWVWGPDESDVVTWNYLRPPFYLLGSKFQVHFRKGVVYGWEPYDD